MFLRNVTWVKKVETKLEALSTFLFLGGRAVGYVRKQSRKDRSFHSLCFVGFIIPLAHPVGQEVILL